MALNLKEPHTYYEWVAVLDAVKNKTDDEEAVELLQKGTLEWQSGVAERFTQKLVETINHRLNLAIDKFQRDMKRSGNQERPVVQALLALKREFMFVYKFANIPAIPEKERNSYCNLIKEQADKVQESLEDSAKFDRSGKLQSMVRNHKINCF